MGPLHRWLSADLVGAILLSGSVHAIPIYQALRDLVEVRTFVKDAREQVHDLLWREYDIELPQPPKPLEEKKEEPPPEPEPAPPPKPIPKAIAPKEAPPAAAQAGKVMTAKEDPSKPVDFGDFTMVQGDADKYAGGVTAAKGTSTSAVYDRNAREGGVPGGTGSAPVPQPVAPTTPDQSRPASIAGGTDWSCPFPPEADAEDINQAVVMIAVTVRPDGSPQSVSVVADPGHGFGRVARSCAMGHRFTPALDRDGNPIVGTTRPFKVRFNR